MPFHANIKGPTTGNFKCRKLANGKYFIRPPSRNFRAIISRKTGTVCYSGLNNLAPVTLTQAVPGTDTTIVKPGT